MLYSTFFDKALFDDFFETGRSYHSAGEMMKADVKELKSCYELTVDMPGVKKEDLKAQLKDGYLTICATINDDDKSEGKYLRRERFIGSFQRTFYVGNEIKQNDIQACLENGVLKLIIPKVTALPDRNKPQYIDVK